MHLKDGTVEKIVELYGYKRVEHVLANTVQERFEQEQTGGMTLAQSM